VLIVDMSGTTFCDSAGVQAIIAAHKQAAATDTQLRVVAPAVMRMLTLVGIDQLGPPLPDPGGSANRGTCRGTQPTRTLQILTRSPDSGHYQPCPHRPGTPQPSAPDTAACVHDRGGGRQLVRGTSCGSPAWGSWLPGLRRCWCTRSATNAWSETRNRRPDSSSQARRGGRGIQRGTVLLYSR
jgi:hypothetical protein